LYKKYKGVLSSIATIYLSLRRTLQRFEIQFSIVASVLLPAADRDLWAESPKAARENRYTMASRITGRKGEQLVSKLRDEAAIWKQEAMIAATWLNKKQNKQLVLLRRKYYCKNYLAGDSSFALRIFTSEGLYKLA